jgi:hypothetical protein
VVPKEETCLLNTFWSCISAAAGNTWSFWMCLGAHTQGLWFKYSSWWRAWSTAYTWGHKRTELGRRWTCMFPLPFPSHRALSLFFPPTPTYSSLGVEDKLIETLPLCSPDSVIHDFTHSELWLPPHSMWYFITGPLLFHLSQLSVNL